MLEKLQGFESMPPGHLLKINFWKCAQGLHDNFIRFESLQDFFARRWWGEGEGEGGGSCNLPSLITYNGLSLSDMTMPASITS